MLKGVRGESVRVEWWSGYGDEMRGGWVSLSVR
jgi:hypothetical protein